MNISKYVNELCTENRKEEDGEHGEQNEVESNVQESTKKKLWISSEKAKRQST